MRALGKCHFFGWLVLHGRCWTSNWLQRHGLLDRDDCALCVQEVETLDHLLTGLAALTLQMESPLAEWWIKHERQL